MKILLLLPLLLGFSVPATAHNEFNGGGCGAGPCAIDIDKTELNKSGGPQMREPPVEVPLRENIDAMGEGADSMICSPLRHEC